MKFKDKLAVITGGSSGIGRALAVALAKEGCHLALCATSETKLLETKKLCDTLSPQTRTTIQNDQQVMDASQAFADSALTSAEDAAVIILTGIRNGQWRILVGADAEELDSLVRQYPDEIYEDDFVDRITSWRPKLAGA